LIKETAQNQHTRMHICTRSGTIYTNTHTNCATGYCVETLQTSGQSNLTRRGRIAPAHELLNHLHPKTFHLDGFIILL